MELIEVIKKRRSIRNYSEKHLDWEIISDILDAGRYAPSSGNTQDWRFIVIRNEDKIKEIAKICSQDWIGKSKALIIICSDLHKVKRMYEEKGELFSIQNTSAAIQNILLRAYDLGVGSCWVGDFNEKELVELLKIKSTAKPYAVITLGYPKEKSKSAERDDLDTVTFFEEYGQRKRKEVGTIHLERNLNVSLNRIKELLNYGKEKLKDAKDK
jgi:nitroreductase